MSQNSSLQDILKKVRQVEIKAKGLSDHIFAGEYHTTFKGRGMSFSEVREYQYGDDVRSIDWNVTARYQHPYIKVFEEERELNIYLLIDISESEIFGSLYPNKRNIATELGATLAFSALKNNDKIGAIFFSDKVEHFIPPNKGKSHVLRIIRDLIAIQPKDKHSTDLNVALDFLNQIQKRKSIVFVLSDFITPPFEKSLSILRKKHDIIAFQIYDQFDQELPSLGLVQVTDAENGTSQWIDTSDKTLQDNYKSNFQKLSEYAENTFKIKGLEFIKLKTDVDFVKILKGFFKRRNHRQ